MAEKRITPIKAIRLKCLDCCCGSSYEVQRCTCEAEPNYCPLYPYRLGKNPYLTGRRNAGSFKQGGALPMGLAQTAKEE